MSSEDDFKYSSVINEEPTTAAELRIFLVDPHGERPPVIWSAEPAKAPAHPEAGTPWSRWIHRIREMRRERRERQIRRLIERNG